MASEEKHPGQGNLPDRSALPFALALIPIAFWLGFHSNYGYFRDELYYIACSNHLALGYVDQPPLSIALLAIVRFFAGDSLLSIRFLPALACAGTVLLAGAMARQLGGARFAQGLAAFSVVAAHSLLGNVRGFSMNPFDVLIWSLALWVVLGILSGQSEKRWLLFGLIVGAGLLNKYSVGFLCIGLAGGLLLSPARRHLGRLPFWGGALVALLIFLPHLIWEIQHDFPSIEFMRNATQNKNVPLSAWQFTLGQLRDINYVNAPLWLLGLWAFFFARAWRPYRAFGWMYLIVFAIMVAAHAKVYYLSAIYPLLLAGGAVSLEGLLRSRSWAFVKVVYPAALGALMLFALPLTVPVLDVANLIEFERRTGLLPHAEERTSVGALPQYYADQFGWEEFARKVGDIYNTLSQEDRAKCVVFVRNYGEAGAIDFFGKAYGLPKAICPHNSYWYWGPGEKTGDVAIILGWSRDLNENLADLRRRWASVQLADTTHCDYCMPYESGRMLFLCRTMNTSFQKLWPDERVLI
ncbi:MAG TPA: glycosyltransferase family 39 protein [Bacteroidota bacterium]|nr:glycosyltransferase family 39 protein [Bacteroidota bacterium]